MASAAPAPSDAASIAVAASSRGVSVPPASRASASARAAAACARQPTSVSHASRRVVPRNAPPRGFCRRDGGGGGVGAERRGVHRRRRVLARRQRAPRVARVRLRTRCRRVRAPADVRLPRVSSRRPAKRTPPWLLSTRRRRRETTRALRSSARCRTTRSGGVEAHAVLLRVTHNHVDPSLGEVGVTLGSPARRRRRRRRRPRPDPGPGVRPTLTAAAAAAAGGGGGSVPSILTTKCDRDRDRGLKIGLNLRELAIIPAPSVGVGPSEVRPRSPPPFRGRSSRGGGDDGADGQLRSRDLNCDDHLRKSEVKIAAKTIRYASSFDLIRVFGSSSGSPEKLYT